MSTDQNDPEIRARGEGTADLLGGLVTDAKELVSTHAQRIKVEVRQELDSLKTTIKLTGAATAAIVLAGLLITQGIVFGLTAATGLPLWAGFGLVGAAFVVVAYAAFRKRLPRADIDLVPEESMANVKRDAEQIAAAVRA
jgi:Putative Actinobacterial Holin-X, holin superfamily III